MGELSIDALDYRRVAFFLMGNQWFWNPPGPMVTMDPSHSGRMINDARSKGLQMSFFHGSNDLFLRHVDGASNCFHLWSRIETSKDKQMPSSFEIPLTHIFSPGNTIPLVPRWMLKKPPGHRHSHLYTHRSESLLWQTSVAPGHVHSQRQLSNASAM